MTRLEKIRSFMSPARLQEFEEGAEYAAQYGGPPLTEEEREAIKTKRLELIKRSR